MRPVDRDADRARANIRRHRQLVADRSDSIKAKEQQEARRASRAERRAAWRERLRRVRSPRWWNNFTHLPLDGFPSDLPSDEAAHREVWTPERVAARRHFIEVIGFVACLAAVGVFTGFGIYRLIVGDVAGWPLLALAGAFVIFALAIGDGLEGER